MYRITMAATLLMVTSPDASFSQTLESNTPAEMRRASDASVDRNIILPSAETIGQGKLSFNSYELFLAGLTYGFTDNLQLSLSGLLPITEDVPLVLVFNGKYRLWHSERFILSVIPSGSIVSKDDVTAGSLGVGMAADLILDQRGHFVLHGGGNILWAWGGADDKDVEFLDGGLFMLNTGMSYRVHKYVKLLFELTLPGGHYNGEFKLVEEGLLLAYGVRFCSASISVDLTFIRPVHPDVDTEFVMGFPFLAFSARF